MRRAILCLKYEAAYLSGISIPPVNSQHLILRLFTANWKIVVILALPIFVAAMWYGISQHFEDMGLYVIAMALASWGVAGRAVFTFRKWQEWRMKSRGGRDA